MSFAWICACSRSFVSFSLFGQFFAKCLGFLHTKRTLEVFPLNCFFLRNLHFFFLKNLFFGSAWYFFLKEYFLKWVLFLSANPSSCSCLWVFVNLFHFWKEFSLIAELFKGNKHMLIDFSQWSLVQSYSLDIHHSKCFISQWFWKRIKEGSLDIHIIHAIDSIKSPWHLIKMSF